MTDLRTAAKMALEAMEKTASYDIPPTSQVRSSITALRTALAQQEPCCGNKASGTSCLADPRQNCPMFTHPPRREWVSLTEEEIWDLAANCLDSVAGRLQFARAIEQALKERNT